MPLNSDDYCINKSTTQSILHFELLLLLIAITLITYYYSFCYFSMTVNHDYCYYYSYSLSFRGALWSFQAHQAFGSATVVEVKEPSWQNRTRLFYTIYWIYIYIHRYIHICIYVVNIYLYTVRYYTRITVKERRSSDPDFTDLP